MNEIRILLADDHTMMRSGLRLPLERQPGFKVVAEARTDAAVDLVESAKLTFLYSMWLCRSSTASKPLGRLPSIIPPWPS